MRVREYITSGASDVIKGLTRVRYAKATNHVSPEKLNVKLCKSSLLRADNLTCFMTTGYGCRSHYLKDPE